MVLHVHPDGDSVGSAIALARALRKLGKQALVVCPDTVPVNLTFIAPPSEWVHPGEVVGGFDLAVFLDCAGLERIGSATELLNNVRRIVNIDHHESNERFGDLNFIEPSSAACAELTYRLITDLGVALDPEMAEALYTAMATDTGSFRYENTGAGTLRLAGELLAAGADAGRVGREVWGNRSLASLKLLHEALGSMQLDLDGRLGWIEVTAEMLARAKATGEDTEGLVDYPRSVRGVEVAILFHGEEPGQVRCSLRSTTRVDVSQLAGTFGGGGHPRAAGCTLAEPLAQAKAKVLEAARVAILGVQAGGSESG